MMLVVTPKPLDGESLHGYVLRVSEANGYSSPASILSIAGYADLTLRSSKFEWQQLSEVLGGIDLSTFSYSNLSAKLINKTTKKSLNSLYSVPGLWRLNSPQICTKCVDEKGHIEAHWDLTCMVACPDHGTYTLSSCYKCSSELKWGRQGLLVCHCGADLRKAPLVIASEETINAVSLFKKLFYNIPISSPAFTKQNPDLDWNSLSFYDLFRLSKLLGKKFPFTPLENNMHIHSVDSLGKIFSNWPVNYHEYLKSVGANSVFENGQAPTLIKQYSSYYGAIKSNKKYGDISNLLVSEFVKFGFEVYGQAFVDIRLMKRVIGKVEPRFLSPFQASKLTGMSPVTLKKWAKKGIVNSSKSQSGVVNRVVLDLTSDVIKKSDEGEILDKRKAAAYAGLPVSILGYLDQNDIFRHDHKSKGKYGFHLKDIDGFVQRALSLAPLVNTTNHQKSKHYSFDYVITHKRFRAASGKSLFVVKYISGDITPAYRSGNAIKDIYFERIEVNRFIESQTREATNSGLSLDEVAGCIEFPRDVISLLYDKGYIAGQYNAGAGLRLYSDSVNSFKEKYVSINSLSKLFDINVVRLLRYCDEHHADVNKQSLKRLSGSRCFFVTRKNSKKLIHYVEKKRKIELDKRALAESLPTKTDLLSSYFQGLQSKNEKLPRRAGIPNLVAISEKIEGLSRNDFYRNSKLVSMLEKIDNDDRERFALVKRDDLKAVVSYLESIASKGRSLPMNKKGKPNILQISKDCGIDRKYFHKNNQAIALVNSAITE